MFYILLGLHYNMYYSVTDYFFFIFRKHACIIQYIFITLGKRNKYLELEVNPDGVQYAGVVENNDGQLNITYLPSSPFFSHVDKKHNCWDCYITIPISNLQKLGFQKDNAYFNLFRQDYDKDTLNLYALNPTNKSTFHDFDSFVKLEIQ